MGLIMTGVENGCAKVVYASCSVGEGLEQEVAEFAIIRRQLQVLEDRLDSMVQPRLTDAITNRKVNIAQDLREILIRIGRYKFLESHYTKLHLKPIRQLWPGGL
ncbi:hypothetical protein L2E82_45065 [Cichorium intybus]|uniref:Uncharacterized protein n=1 Tax=Cichorium intybus TaxID=13427 RepID=A0ACB8ZSA9_CICIN|nr:hypothetical protein L2E82_45065 [Cichorium intybus]